jgi:hypothetical protein
MYEPPQPNIEINVDFYDESHKKSLLTYPKGAEIQSIVNDGVSIPTEEFLTYWLFHKKRSGAQVYENFQDIASRTGDFLVTLKHLINFNSISICNPSDVDDPSITESLGEAIGLGTISKIHDLIEADWHPIKTHSGRSGFPTFDYSYDLASDGESIIQLECKGSSTDDNRKKRPLISNHKKNIEKKKEKIESHKDYLYPAISRYGTIGVRDSRQDGKLQCWLLDPPPEFIPTSPKVLKLLKRMEFLRFWISLHSPRSALAISLNTRTADIMKLSDPFELNHLPLRRGNNEFIEFFGNNFSTDKKNVHHKKSYVIDGNASGITVSVSKSQFFFLGIDHQLINIAQKQDFKEISNFHMKPKTVLETVRCRLKGKEFDPFDFSMLIEEVIKEDDFIPFNLKGYLHYSPSGLVFGILS